MGWTKGIGWERQYIFEINVVAARVLSLVAKLTYQVLTSSRSFNLLDCQPHSAPNVHHFISIFTADEYLANATLCASSLHQYYDERVSTS